MASKHREVINIIPAKEVLKKTLPPFPHIEVREDSRGNWRVFYPDPGWIPCAPVCRLKEVERSHKHTYEQAWIETNYTPSSYADAVDWATLLAEGREVKAVPYKTLAERNAERRRAA